MPTPAGLFPPLSDTLSAIMVPGAARVDGCAVRDALLRAAVAQGAQVRTGTATLTPTAEVILHPEPCPPDQPERPADDGVRIEADKVIVAAGAWTGEVCRPLGVELPVFPGAARSCTPPWRAWTPRGGPSSCPGRAPTCWASPTPAS
ncbi:FAD-dependent oxidoreductase [Nonomuraea antimicrobica]